MAIDYSVKQRSKIDLYRGFSENLYGNNWFILSTNEGLAAGRKNDDNLKPKYTSICGILDDIPTLDFSTSISEGPQQTATDFLVKTFSIGSDGNGGVLGAVGAATGANLSKQLAGGYTAQMARSEELSGEFKLSFKVWKRPGDLFDPTCPPSNQSEVIKYLTDYATVDATDTFLNMASSNVDRAIAGIGRVLPIAKSAVEEAGKVIFGDDKSSKDMGFLDTIETAVDAVAAAGDQLLARGWSDRQRIALGKLKFNESLHRLDILRAGILDSYFIVAITDWSYKLDQDSMGEKMEVQITCKVDQRMRSNRLKLYSEEKKLPVK
jgi:hypothetical protein